MSGAWEESLLTRWFIGIKHPNQIRTLYDTNTVLLLTTVIIIDTLFLPMSQKTKWDYYFKKKKKTPCGGLVKFSHLIKAFGKTKF